jgi:hypothetical protein
MAFLILILFYAFVWQDGTHHERAKNGYRPLCRGGGLPRPLSILFPGSALDLLQRPCGGSPELYRSHSKSFGRIPRRLNLS